MNYIIKPGKWVVIATYPTPNSFIRPHLTKHINFFTNDNFVFRGKAVFDLNIVDSPLVIFLNGSWWGFRKGYNILITIPENIANLNMKKPPPKEVPKIIPFENMYSPISDRISFEEWLKKIGYMEEIK